MNVADLLHSLTVDGLSLRVGPGEALEVIGDVSKLSLNQQRALRGNKQLLLSMLLTPPATCLPDSIEAEREAIRFADTPEAMGALKEAIEFFDHLAGSMRWHNPAALAGVVLEPDASPTPCKRCWGTQTFLAVIHAGESLRRDCAKCGFFRDFPAWNNRELAGEILSHAVANSRYNERRAAQVLEHPSSPNDSLWIRKENADG